MGKTWQVTLSRKSRFFESITIATRNPDLFEFYIISYCFVVVGTDNIITSVWTLIALDMSIMIPKEEWSGHLPRPLSP